MKQCAAIFLPSKESQVGLWTPGYNNEWVVQSAQGSPHSGNSVVTALTTLLTGHGLSPTSLTHIGVVNGPGPYTQLRSHVATANALAWSLNLSIFAFTPEHKLPEALAELCLSAKRNHVIEAIYPSQIG